PSLPSGHFVLCVGGQQQVVLTALNTVAEPEQGLAAAVDGRIRIVNAICPIDTGKYGLQGIVIALRDGIELVVVTTRALDRGAGEGLHDRRDHVVAVEVAANLPVNRVLSD